MKKLLESLLSLLPYAILTLLTGLVFVTVLLQGLSYGQLVELLGILVWPIIVLIALLFFRKVFTYMFFSIEEFNFFGAKGTLKNVQAVIREKADELWQREKDDERAELERVKFRQEIDSLRDSASEKDGRNARILKLAEELIDSQAKLRERNLQLKKQVDVLVAQVSSLQAGQSDILYSESPAEEAELEDVGSVNPESDSSENNA